MDVKFSDLTGKIIKSVKVEDESIVFTMNDDSAYEMKHFQDCCESVYLADVTGDWDDIVGQPITSVFENFQDQDCDYGIEGWTFYTIATFKGAITLRWNGSSNGYYSIGVDFCKMENGRSER